VQGLKKLTVEADDLPSGYGSLVNANDQKKNVCKELEALLQERLSMARSET